MRTQEELIAYYEKQLEKVISAYKDSHKGEDYINYAREQLEAVKNGRTW